MAEKFTVGSCTPIQEGRLKEPVRFSANDLTDKKAREWILALYGELEQLKERIANLENERSGKSLIN